MSDATRVAIIGLGAIGGSVALKLVERGVTPRGWSVDPEDRRLAAAAGIRVADSIESAAADSDLILLAVPLDQLAPVAQRVAHLSLPSATILHAASLQRPAATRFDQSLSRRILGTHPLAGTAQSGFAAANADLFRGATVYAETPVDRRAGEDAELFWSMAGASRVEYLPAEQHDDLMAAVSHLPQLVAVAIAATLGYSDVPCARLGPGGRDMTRLAESSWAMWKPLLAASPGRTLALLESVESELRQMRKSIGAGNLDEVGSAWSVGRGWRLEERVPATDR